VQEYHQSLHGQGLLAQRSLDDDLAITEPVLKQG